MEALRYPYGFRGDLSVQRRVREACSCWEKVCKTIEEYESFLGVSGVIWLPAVADS